MPLKQFTANFQNIGQQEFLRPNVGYRYFFDVQKAKVYPARVSIKLKHILKEISAKKVSKGLLNDSEILVDIGNIKRRFNYLINLEEVNEIGSDKNILQAGDIVIPKMQPRMGNIFLNLEHKKYIGSTELIEYSISKSYNPLFLYYFITSKKFLSDLANLESGKTHRRVNPTDLLKIKIPLIPKSTQDKLVSEIEPIERKIKDLWNQITPPQEIINKVFAGKFNFDLEKFKKVEKKKFFEIDFSSISKFGSLRKGVKNYKKNYEYLFNFLNFIKTIKLSKIFSYIRNSTAPELDNNGNHKVVKIAQLRNGYIDYESCESVSDQFFQKNEEQLKIRKGDIFIVNRGTGSIGKVDLCEQETEEDYLIGGSIYILRKLNSNFNHQFITYFLRSILGYFQMEFGFFGNTNQIALYLPILNNIKIPSISLKAQQKIVGEIKAQLDKQEEIIKKIQNERNKIDQIIERAIRK